MAQAEERTFQPVEYWNIIRRRRWAVIACLLVVLAAVILRTVVTKPTYRATAQLQIERENPNILPFKEIFSGGAQFDDFYETQYQLMKSRNVARRVLVAIGDVPPPSATPGSGTGATGMPTRAVPAAATVVGGPPPTGREGTEGGNETPSELTRIDGLLTAIQIEPIKNSRLVRIHAVATEPERAATIANALADCYVAFILKEKFSTTDALAIGLSGQIAEINSDLVRREQELQKYAINNDIIALSDKRNATMQRFDDLNLDYTRAISARIDTESRWRSAKRSPPDSFGEVLQSPLIKDLQNNISRLEGEYQQLSATFKPGWPALDRKKSETETALGMLDEARLAIVRRVLASAEKDYRTAAAHEESLRQEVERQKKEIQDLNLKKIGYDSLKAELDSKRQIYSDLVTRQNQTGVTKGVEGEANGNVRIVDRAEVPTRIYKPNRLLNVLLGFVLGLAFGIGAAFALESIDNTVKTIEDVQNILQKPALGVVPFLGGNVTVEPREGDAGLEPFASIEAAAREPRSPAAEAFRELRTSVLLSAAGAPPRSLLVTSSRPGEGKTATAINLSVALAQIDRRILLIDCDLRRPRIHKVLELRERDGLSNYLSSRDVPLSAIITPTDVPNLFVILSGPIPPNPAELLASERFEQLMTDATTGPGGFDHVILDSSPLLSVADPVILATRAEAAILIVDAGSTPKGALLRAREKLMQSKVNLLGAVLNKVDRSSDGYYEYGYRYGQYRYEYGEGTTTQRSRRSRRDRSASKSNTA